MDAELYRDITAGPDVVRRPVVEATIRRLENYPELAARLTRLLKAPPIVKPAGHGAGSHSDFLRVDLTIPELEDLVSALGDNEAGLLIDDAPTSTVSYAGSLLDIWNSSLIFRKTAA